MTTGDVVYSLRCSLIKILSEPGFDLGSTAGESCVLTARLHMLYYPYSDGSSFTARFNEIFVENLFALVNILINKGILMNSIDFVRKVTEIKNGKTQYLTYKIIDNLANRLLNKLMLPESRGCIVSH